jgi:hypothetical protein
MGDRGLPFLDSIAPGDQGDQMSFLKVAQFLAQEIFCQNYCITLTV